MDLKHTKVKNLTDAGNSGLFTDGDWVESKDQDPQGEIRLIQLADVGINKFKDKSNRYLTKSKASELNCTYLKKGDLLISRLPDPLGRTCMFPLDGDRKYVTVVDVSILRVDEEAYNSKYVEYILNAPQTRQKVQSKKTGTTRKRISRKNLAEIEIPIPPLPTQHSIVEKIEELFSELDNGVENLQKAQQQLKTYRQAVLKDAFEGKLTKEWREQQDDLPTPEKLLQQIKAERKAHRQRELAEWEKEVEQWEKEVEQWEKDGKPGRKPRKPRKVNEVEPISEKELNKLAELPNNWLWLKLGRVIDQPKYGTSEKCDYDFDGFGVLRIPNIGKGIVDSEDMKYAPLEEDEASKYALQVGDILTIRSNGSIDLVGKCALIRDPDTNFLHAGYLIRLRPYKGVADSRYLLNILSSVSLRSQIESKAKSTSGVNNINSGELQDLIIPLCSIKEQKEIVKEIESRLSVVDQLEQTINENLQKAEALLQSILKKAFCGELVEK